MSPEDFEALVVGRRKGGAALVDAPIGSCPATIKAAEHLTRAQLNDFNYDGHDVDDICPAHSHIRKMNRRLRADQKEFQIARRGMSYGPERRDLEAGPRQLAPSEGVGLLFMALHSKPDEAAGLLIRASSGDKDALLGRSVGGAKGSDEVQATEGLAWPISDAKTGGKFFYKMGDFVTLKGGEYFFVPSMHLINNFGKLVLGDS
jgi:deferrochelatase/peroxidase EfeB